MILLFIMALMGIAACAQGIVGIIFNQNASQDKDMLQQIAALQLYESYLQKGYKITKDGTGAISDIKNGDLLQHSNHFDSLKIVSSRIRNYGRIQDIIDLDKDILGSFTPVWAKLNADNALTTAQLADYKQAYNNLTVRTSADMDELQLVITNGKVQMTDDQRIGKIDRLYYDMQRIYANVRLLNTQSLNLAAQRQREVKDRASMRSLYGQ